MLDRLERFDALQVVLEFDVLCRRGPEPHRPAGAAQVTAFPAPLVGRGLEIDRSVVWLRLRCVDDERDDVVGVEF
jgi:hypothetical protein